MNPCARRHRRSQAESGPCDYLCKHWGAQSSLGKGRGYQYKPEGGYYDQLVKVELRAKRLGTCPGHSKRAYTKLRARVQKKPGGHYGEWFSWSGSQNICEPGFGAKPHDGSEARQLGGASVAAKGLRSCGTANFGYTRARISARRVKCKAARQLARKWLHGLGPGDCQSFPCYANVENYRCRFSGTEAHLKLRCKNFNDHRKRVHADWGG